MEILKTISLIIGIPIGIGYLAVIVLYLGNLVLDTGAMLVGNADRAFRYGGKGNYR